LLEHLDVAELDRIIGVLYELVERWFQVAIGIAFSAVRRRWSPASEKRRQDVSEGLVMP